MTAARSPPRSEPANSHALRPSAIPRSARSAALLVRQIRPSRRNTRREDHRAGANLVGQRRQTELDALAGIALALAVEGLCWRLLEQDHRQQAGAGQPRATTWNGAGAWPMLSQARQV